MKIHRTARLHDYQNENVISSFFLVLKSPVERKYQQVEKIKDTKKTQSIVTRDHFEVSFSSILHNMIKETRFA